MRRSVLLLLICLSVSVYGIFLFRGAYGSSNQRSLAVTRLQLETERLARLHEQVQLGRMGKPEAEALLGPALERGEESLEMLRRVSPEDLAVERLSGDYVAFAQASSRSIRRTANGFSASQDGILGVFQVADARFRRSLATVESAVAFEVADIPQRLRYAIAMILLGPIGLTWVGVRYGTELQRQRMGRLLVERRALRSKEIRLLSLLENSSDVSLVVDDAARIMDAAPSLARVLGYQPQDVCHKSLFSLVHTDDTSGLLSYILEALRPRGVPGMFALKLRHRDGGWLEFESLASRIGTEDSREVVLNCRDVTSRREAERALRESEERYALAARGANDGLWDWDLASGRVYFSPRWKGMLGYGDTELGDDPEEWLSRVHPADQEAVRTVLSAQVGGEVSQFQCEHRLFHRNGAYLWVLCRGLVVRDESGRARRLVGSQTDITERKAAEERLQHSALHDSLTGLPNRALFVQSLESALTNLRNHPESVLAILLLDLDGFKYVNDSLGHLAGDRLLVGIARRLLTCVRAGDTVARLGGDEFAILLEDIQDLGQASMIAERILTELTHPFDIAGSEVFASGSIGIASNRLSSPELEDLLRDADIALYEAKGLGRARFALFDAEMHRRAAGRLQLENDLRRAVERSEFVAYYQPIVSLHDQEVLGYEALVRWEHPSGRMVDPDEFVPIAEETRLIAAIDNEIFRFACRRLKDWLLEDPTQERFVSINISGPGLGQLGLVERIEETLRDLDLPGRCIHLEITERAVMTDPERTAEIMRRIRALGVRFAIDDFGTGYSSLGHLHRLPFDLVKLDRAFLQEAASEVRQREFLGSVVALAHTLGLQVVAEGIETSRQLALLRACGCDQAQGYLFGRPARNVWPPRRGDRASLPPLQI